MSTNTTLYEMILDLLVVNRNNPDGSSKLDECQLVVSEEMQKYIITLINNHSIIFSDIESSLKKIVSDGKIDSKDTPEILLIVGKIYELIYKSKNINVKADYYEIVSTLMLLCSTVYLKNNVFIERDTIENLNKIVSASIELIKLKSNIKPPKFKIKSFF